MGDMVDAFPPALEWVEDALRGARQSDRFALVRSAVIWTATTLPSGETCGGADGDAVARRLLRGVLVFGDGHAALQPVGWVVNAAMFAPADAPAFVAAVIGFYDNERTPSLSEPAEYAFRPPEHRPPTDAELTKGLVVVGAHHREIDSTWLRDLVATAPLGVSATIDWEYRHSIEVHEILTFVVHPGLLALAASSNARVKAVFDWCFDQLAAGFLATTKQDTHILLETNVRNCTVRFHIPAKSPAVILQAREGIEEAVGRARALVESMSSQGIALREVKYRFDVCERVWVPWYAASDDGTLHKHPGLLISHEGLPDGLSLAGRYEEAPGWGPDDASS